MNQRLMNYLAIFLFFCSTAFGKDYPIKKILTVSINSSINPGTLNYIKKGFTEAKEKNYDALCINLNTPGGLVTTTKDIITLIGKSSIPVIVRIYPEGASATSAGAIISASAHLLFMSPGTNIGAATPITSGGDIEDKDVRNKAVNDLVALVSSLSEARGRSVKSFKQMVEKASSFSANEALKKNIIDGIISSQNEMRDQMKNKEIVFQGEKVTLVPANELSFIDLPMDLGQKILSFFANPSFAYILFIIGVVLIYFELQAPGGLIAGSIGALCLVLAAIGFQVLPLNFGAMGLIVLSFILFFLEIYITSYGLLAIAGLASLIFGSLFLFRTDDSLMDISYVSIYGTISIVVLCLLILGYVIFKDLRTKKRDSNDILGSKGKVLSIDGDMIKARINGEIWTCESASILEVGDHVEIIEKSKTNLKIKIQKV